MQLELAWRDADGLKRELEQRTGMPLSLTLTDNTSTMLSLKRCRHTGKATLRLHRMFLHADPPVVQALSDWVSHPRARRSGTLIDEFIEKNRHHIEKRAKRPKRLRTRGRVHDLPEMYAEINAAFFENAVDAPITWGKMPARRRRRRSILYGSYTPEDHLIRIHPLLDQPFVPAYVVKFVVFHEMLHARLGVKISPTGRRQVHTAEFRRLESAYPDYGRACAWLDSEENLRRLLLPLTKSAASWKPRPLANLE